MLYVNIDILNRNMFKFLYNFDYNFHINHSKQWRYVDDLIGNSLQYHRFWLFCFMK